MSSLRPVAHILPGITVCGLLLPGCGHHSPMLPGPGGGEFTSTLTGVVTVDDFVVGADERVRCVGDVTVQCKSAAVRGEMLSAPPQGTGQDGASIAIRSEGNIEVTGGIVAGSGTGGAAEADGGSGGGIQLASEKGDIALGADAAAAGGAPPGAPPRLHTGDGADGGDGKVGGAGGAGGDLTLECPDGTLTINQTPGLIHLGNGGHGGRASIQGEELLTATVPEQMPNAGGDSGGLIPFCKNLVGVELEQSGGGVGFPELIGALDDGVGSGGHGGNAGSLDFGRDPDTGLPTWPATVPPRRESPAELWPAPTRGADGGEGACTGGHGESIIWDASGMQTPEGAPGAAANVRGGDGGSCGHTWGGVIGHITVGLFVDREVQSGNGGDVEVWGAPGGNGGECMRGGAGAKVRAEGGDAGIIYYARTKVKYMDFGRAGLAWAHGGKGGDAGHCCDPPAAGKTGGDGGLARAIGGVGPIYYDGEGHQVGMGGHVWAYGGHGGNGGDGQPPGTGGDGGKADPVPGFGAIWGLVKARASGKPGRGGYLCPVRPPDGDEIVGTVIDELGNAIADLSIVILPDESDASDGTRGQAPSATTNANGIYTFADVAPGKYLILPPLPQRPDFWDPFEQKVTKMAGVGVAGQDFVLRTGGQYTVRVPVKDQAGSAMAGVRVRLLDTIAAAFYHNTGGDGVAVFDGVWSGRVEVTVDQAPPAGLRWDPPLHLVDVGQGDVTTPEFRLVPD